MNDSQLPPTDALTGQSSPGEMLRHGRQALEISREDVAVALNLRPAVIQGLEDDSYDEVPVAIYRRGYLRSYANLLGMDPDVVLAAYQARHADTDHAVDIQTRPLQLQKRPSSIGTWLFRLMTLIVIIGLAGLTWMWWQSRGGNEPPTASDSEPVAVDSRNGTITLNEPAKTQQASADSSLEATAESSELSTPMTTDQPSADQESASETVADAAVAGEQEPSATPSQEAAALAATSDTGAEANAEASQANANQLTLVFNKESWVQIVDASGKTIFTGLQKAGTDATIEGTPPLNLTIGNANGVEMTWRGDTENVGSRATAGNVARFTLGE
ncbi:RodZ domain-containing protein [Halomonas halocynthiae]|uniref:RodZ domain-containing protein n=1 Tax=Halomonas halocynthiae TaxID=176290 RepID=UPI0003F91A8E|nr:RodZ family helix-turn-helix domain-containing protein [Halomonas halocynthiae]